MVILCYCCMDDKRVEGKPCPKCNPDIIECEECRGIGFSRPGTGYDRYLAVAYNAVIAVCDNCDGLGRYPKQ